VLGSASGERVRVRVHFFVVTPAIFKPGSIVVKAPGFPIKDLGNDGGGCHP